MIFNVRPYEGVGKIRFGETRKKARLLLDADFVSFKRTPMSELPCDEFESLGVFIYYKKPKLVEAVEFSKPAIVIYANVDLLSVSFDKFKSFLASKDSNIEVENDSVTSYKLGIGGWSRNAETDANASMDSVIVFEKDYYG